MEKVINSFVVPEGYVLKQTGKYTYDIVEKNVSSHKYKVGDIVDFYNIERLWERRGIIVDIIDFEKASKKEKNEIVKNSHFNEYYVYEEFKDEFKSFEEFWGKCNSAAEYYKIQIIPKKASSYYEKDEPLDMLKYFYVNVANELVIGDDRWQGRSVFCPKCGKYHLNNDHTKQKQIGTRVDYGDEYDFVAERAYGDYKPIYETINYPDHCPFCEPDKNIKE